MKRTIKRWHWMYSDGTLSNDGYAEKFAWSPPRAPYVEWPVLVTMTYDDGKPKKPRRKRAPGGKAPACRGKPR